MAKRNTETLFLRVDPEVARLVRRACDEREVTLSQLGEVAFRKFLAATTTEEERKNLLSGVEEALVGRIDQRKGQVLERIAGLYAKEAFDHAEGLYLMKAIVSMTTRDEKLTERYFVNARKDATERLKNRTGPVAEALAQSRAQIDQLTKDVAEARRVADSQYERAERQAKELSQAAESARRQEHKNQELQEQLEQQRRLHEFDRARDEWAAQQVETQGMLRRKTFQEWRAEYLKQHPLPPRVG